MTAPFVITQWQLPKCTSIVKQCCIHTMEYDTTIIHYKIVVILVGLGEVESITGKGAEGTPGMLVMFFLNVGTCYTGMFCL